MISTTFKLIKSAGATVLILLFAGMAMAQPGQKKIEKREKAEAMKIGFITNRLNLTQDEAKKFWPVYKEYKQKVHQLNQSQRPSKPIEQMSDAEKTSFINTMLDNEIKAAEIKRDYYVSFQKILPVAKVAKLEMAERSFKKELIGKMAGENRRR